MESWTIFADESGTNEQYLCYGAILIPTAEVACADARLEAFCCAKGLNRELSWKACSPNEIKRYCKFAERFWMLRQEEMLLEFRSMVVDTGKYPLANPNSRIGRGAGFVQGGKRSRGAIVHGRPSAHAMETSNGRGRSTRPFSFAAGIGSRPAPTSPASASDSCSPDPP